MSEELLELKRAILEAALRHVPFDGWSERSLRLALEERGLERSAGLRAFPRGADDLLAFFLAEGDRALADELARRDLGALKVRDRVALGLRLRLELLAPHREAVRRAIAQQSLPPHAGGALKRLYRTVDTVWRGAGDEATDFNFYTKRALLAWVFGATLLYWLDDDTPGHAATWAFLDRRLDEVMGMRAARLRLGEALASRLRRKPAPRSKTAGSPT
jgi:ubiquinone biosynthesis protein COQ9